MATVGEIYDAINALAPFDTQLGFDNSGLLIGSRSRQVTRVLIALDATMEVAGQAAALGCELLITHHPVIFTPARTIAADSPVYRLIAGGVDIICAHTNLDIADGGVNTCLAEKLGFTEFSRHEWLELGVVAQLSESMTARQLAGLTAERLACDGVRASDGGRPIRNVAVIGGAGGGELPALIGRVDALITGEAKHNQFIEAADAGITLIAAGHYETESVVLEPLMRKLAEQFADVTFSLEQSNPTFICNR